MKATGLSYISLLLISLKHPTHFGSLPSLTNVSIEKRLLAIDFDSRFHREVLLQSMNALRMNLCYSDSAAFALSNTNSQAFQV